MSYFLKNKNKYFISFKSIKYTKIIPEFSSVSLGAIPALRCIFLCLKTPQEGCRFYPGYENEIVCKKYYACIVYYSN